MSAHPSRAHRLGPLLVVAAALAALPLAAQPFDFSALHPVAGGPATASGVVAADFDRDGDLDVAFTSSLDGSVSWAANDGSMGFATIELPGGLAGAAALAVGDVDRDGLPDLVAVGTDDGQPRLYENLLDEFFPVPTGFVDHLLPALSNPAVGGWDDIVIADLDRDGDADLVAVSRVDGVVAVYRQTPLRGFVPELLHPDAVGGPIEVRVADVDGDGRPDVVVAATDETDLRWYAGLPDGSFDDRSASSLPQGAASVAVADVDADGQQDFVTAAGDGDALAWHENDGTQVFTPQTLPSLLQDPRSLAPVDLDEDGDLDVAMATADGFAVLASDAQPDPEFSPHFLATGDLAEVVVLDLDRDGDLDVLAAGDAPSGVGWYENLAPPVDALFPPDASIADSFPGSGPSGIDTGDLDRDGSVDWVVGMVTPGDDVVFLHPGFGPRSDVAVGAAHFVDGVNGVEMHDLDGDGDLDVLSAAALGDDVAWHENLGGQPPAFAHHLIDGDADATRHATAGDLDGDGDLDVVAAAGGADDAIYWYENDGAGGFSAPRVAAADVLGARSVELGDLDGDGDLDIAYGAMDATVSEWLRNDGGNPTTFVGKPLDNPVGPLFWVRIGDWDGDGRNDLLASSFATHSVVLWRNLGPVPPEDGGPPVFELVRQIEDVLGATDVELVDIEGDGDLDGLVAARDADRVVWIENRTREGRAELVRPLPIPCDGALSLASADLFRDGTTDLVVAAESAGAVFVFDNQPALFWDGFESGDLEAWGSAVGRGRGAAAPR